MLNQQAQLDLAFQALADPTRRAMVERLTRGPSTVSELAKPFSMSLPAIMQHLAVLEGSGLVTTKKLGRARTCQVDPMALRRVEQWIEAQRSEWERRFDRLGAYLDELKREGGENG